MKFKTPLKYQIIAYIGMPFILLSYLIGGIIGLIDDLIGKITKIIKLIILNLFLSLFKKELDNVEPEVDSFLAKLIKPYLGGY